MNPICGHGLNIGYGSYVENDACNFCQHLKDSPYVLVGKISWLESSSTLSSTSEIEKMDDMPKEVIHVSSSIPSTNVDNTSFAAFEKHTKGIDIKLLTQMGYDGRGLRVNVQGNINHIEVKERPRYEGLGYGHGEI